MRKNKKIFFLLAAIIGLAVGLVFSMQNHQLIFADETGYRDYDKHKAVNTCMEKIYLEQYHSEPAERDDFHTCEQRYRELSQALSHADFLKAKNQAPALNADGSFAPNPYYDILFGRPSNLPSGDLPSGQPLN